MKKDTVYFSIERSRCKQCGRCASECPAGAVFPGDTACTIDPQRCIRCAICYDVCPHGAVIQSSCTGAACAK